MVVFRSRTFLMSACCLFLRFQRLVLRRFHRIIVGPMCRIHETAKATTAFRGIARSGSVPALRIFCIRGDRGGGHRPLHARGCPACGTMPPYALGAEAIMASVQAARKSRLMMQLAHLTGRKASTMCPGMDGMQIPLRRRRRAGGIAPARGAALRRARPRPASIIRSRAA